MKTQLIGVIFLLVLFSCHTGSKSKLRQGDFFTEGQAKAELQKLESLYSNKTEWEARKQFIRENILKGLNLSPLPKRTSLNSVVSSRRIKDGYSVENVYFESIPGYYVCGNLYRPLDNSKKHPAILCPHGHFYSDSLGGYGRFRPDMQNRCASFARMGAVVFSYNMYGWGESIKQLDSTAIIETPDTGVIRRNHSVPFAMTMQTWNSMRIIDFLTTLSDVDSSKIAITGASGGGTQTFLLAALDDRVSVSVPVVMVSCHFFGGCGCESGLPVHQSENYFTNNAEIASMIAPKPMLLISDGSDWTKNVPTVEFPFIKRTYSLYKADENVENAHFPNGQHDYAFEKRIPVYAFLAKHLGLELKAITTADGSIDESKNTIESSTQLLVFSTQNPFPASALKGEIAIKAKLKSLQ